MKDLLRLRMQEMLEVSNIGMRELSRRTGLAYNTIRALKRGEGNPTIGTVDRVYEQVFAPKEGVSCLDCKWCDPLERYDDFPAFCAAKGNIIGRDRPCLQHRTDDDK